MLNTLYQLLLELRNLNIRPSHWIVGGRVLVQLMAELPPGAVMTELSGVTRIFGVAVEVDRDNHDRMALAPADRLLSAFEATPDADRLLKQVLG
jgi:hypothetical protein